MPLADFPTFSPPPPLCRPPHRPTPPHATPPHTAPHRTRVVIVSYAELKAADALGRSRRGNLSIQRMSTISRSSVGLSATIYIVGALFGYLTFRNGINKDLLIS